MSQRFYSKSHQFTREWRVLWPLYRTDILLGCLYIVSSFYFFRMVGNSQVYNVIMPYFMASVVSAYLTFSICGPQIRGASLPHFMSLPREQKLVWKSQTAFILFILLCFELLIALGVAIKLGGLDLPLCIVCTLS